MTRQVVAVLIGCAAVCGTAAGAPAAKSNAAVRPNVLLITVDSLRADRLGCYTGGARTTPAIDALAARGVRFGRAYASSPSTAPSSATILTGVYPSRHGLRHDLGGHLAGGVPTVASILKAAGYRTGAVVGSFHLGSIRGLDRGFDSYDDAIKGIRKKIVGTSKERRADEVVQAGLRFLESAPKDRPFFLWLDFYDPHYDYEPPAELKEKYDKDPYQGEVANVDAQIGRFLEALKARGGVDATAIVLAGSHGEGLGDHGETGHGIYLYETTIKVPLLMVPADASQAPGRVVQGAVGLVDLLPTILDMAGLPAQAGLDGRSLAPLLKGKNGEPEERRYFIEAVQPREAYGWGALYAVVEGDRKVVQGQRLESFDLRQDPGETKPQKQAPGWASRLAAYGRPLAGTFDPPQEMRREVLEQARALSLPWDNTPICLDRQVWPDPRDRVDLNQTLFEARIAFDHGVRGLAYQKGQEVLLKDETNFTALEMVIFLSLTNRWLSMIEEPLGMMQCNYPWRGTPYHYLAHYLDMQKDFEKARKALAIYARLEPWEDEPEYDLAALYAEQGMKEEAFDHLKRAIAMGATDFSFIRRDSRFGKLLGDPRFADLVGPVTPAPEPPVQPQKPN